MPTTRSDPIVIILATLATTRNFRIIVRGRPMWECYTRDSEAIKKLHLWTITWPSSLPPEEAIVICWTHPMLILIHVASIMVNIIYELIWCAAMHYSTFNLCSDCGPCDVSVCFIMWALWGNKRHHIFTSYDTLRCTCILLQALAITTQKLSRHCCTHSNSSDSVLGTIFTTYQTFVAFFTKDLYPSSCKVSLDNGSNHEFPSRLHIIVSRTLHDKQFPK